MALILLCATGALGYGAGKGDPGGVAYRWVDEKGIVHYGDRVPPQYSKQESAILNRQGVEVGRTEAQKTPEQLAADAREQQAIIRQKQHDAFLLTTYTSVADIESLRDERLAQINGQRRAAEQYIEGLHARLSALQTRAFTFKPYSDKPGAHRMPDDLAEDLMRTLNEVRSQTSALATRDAEESALRAQFQADIERYRELHASRSSR